MIDGSGKRGDLGRGEAAEEDVGREALPMAKALSVEELLVISLSVIECREWRGDRGAGINDWSSIVSNVVGELGVMIDNED